MMTQTFTHHWPVYGHDWAVDYLRKGMTYNRIRQAYLIVGMSAIGKNRFAHAFAMAMNCTNAEPAERPCGVCRSCKLIMSGNHPDMVYSETDPNTGALKIEAIRAVTQRLALKPYEARHRIAIVSDFEKARGQAQDALLKTLEEPPPYAILILLASSIEPILSTITSRSQTIHLRPVPSDELAQILVNHYQAEPAQATLLARLSGGRIGWAINALQNPDVLTEREEALNGFEDVLKMNRAERFNLADKLSKDRHYLVQTLELWQTYWRDLLLLAENSPVKPCNSDRIPNMERMLYTVNADQALTALNATRTMIGNMNINVNLRLALEVMFLDYPGLRG